MLKHPEVPARASLPWVSLYGRPTSYCACAVVAFLMAGPLSPNAHADGPSSVDLLEKAAGDWVKVRAETAQIESDWTSQKPFLASMVDGLTERADAADAKREFLQAKTAKDREDISNLEASGAASSAGLKSVETKLSSMDARLLRLRASLPPRLSAALELPYKGLTADGVAVGERMRLTMAVLNRCIQFNRIITCDDEVIDTGAGKDPQLMEVIYWGLSHGYALDRARGAAWFGSPGPSGWRWEPLPDGAHQVEQLIAVYRGRSEPRFVEVAARVAGSHAGAPAQKGP